jgi:hypothetical protein
MESQKPTRHSQADVLQQFQLERLSIAEKSSKEFGLKMSQKIWSTVTSGIGGYYANRNAQFLENRNYANGRIDVQSMFQDRFQINGKQDYIRLVWQTLQIVNRIISGLVGRWMARGEKIQVQAIDTISVEDKIKEFQDLEYVVYNRKMLEQLQEQSGVQLIPQGEIPTDKDELEMWQSQFQRLPEEILTELACNEVLGANGWFDVLKEKMLHDSAEVGLVGTCVEMDDKGVIYIKYIKPENQIYSWTEYPDMRDTTWRGELPDIKISELRRQYGKEFNPENPNALTEEQLWEIARTAKEFKNYSNIQWTNVWYNAFMRPYDEWNVRCMKFELRSVDKEPYTVTKTKTTGTTYTQKGMPTTASGKTRPKPLDNQQVLDDSNINIYRGVYLPDNDTLLEWGLKKNMIRPQDPKEIGNAEFSYSYYMPQIYQMRNLAIPEKIKAAVNGMILALLKIQQVIARLVPSGWAIDETALQEVDYGLGDNNNQVDQARYYFQTGLMYYRGIGADGKRIEPPIKELVNNGFVGQMDGLIKSYQFWYQTLKDDLGEDPNLIAQALQPRVTTGNVDAAQQSANEATDQYYRAYAECMKMTARKVSCLLKDSVLYGAKVYRNILSEKDIENRIFNTDIRFLPTQQEVLRFEQYMQQTIAANPDLALFIDPFRLIRIAKEDVKLAEMMFQNGQKKMLIDRQQQAQRQIQDNAKAQQDSAVVAETEKRKTLEKELEIKQAIAGFEGNNKLQELLITMAGTSLGKEGAGLPPEWKATVDGVMKKVQVQLGIEAVQVQQQIQAEAQEQPQEQQIEQQQGMEQPMEGQEQMQQEQQPVLM